MKLQKNKNIWDADNAVIRENFIALNTLLESKVKKFSNK